MGPMRTPAPFQTVHQPDAPHPGCSAPVQGRDEPFRIGRRRVAREVAADVRRRLAGHQRAAGEERELVTLRGTDGDDGARRGAQERRTVQGDCPLVREAGPDDGDPLRPLRAGPRRRRAPSPRTGARAARKPSPPPTPVRRRPGGAPIRCVRHSSTRHPPPRSIPTGRRCRWAPAAGGSAARRRRRCRRAHRLPSR